MNPSLPTPSFRVEAAPAAAEAAAAQASALAGPSVAAPLLAPALDARMDPYTRPNDLPLLAVLTLAHFFNDVCIGVVAPMIPRLESKFSMSLGQVAALVGVILLMGNFSQPLAGWLADRSKTLAILVLTPMISGLAFFVGLTREPWQASILFVLAGLAIGVFHPFAFIAAQTTLPRRPALASSIFISGGFIGVAYGARLSGRWMEARGFESFHLLYLGAAAVSIALLLRGLPTAAMADFRLFQSRGGGRSSSGESRTIPFALLWTIALLFGLQVGALSFFVPKLFHLQYGSEGLGGDASFLLGLCGGLISYLYAYLAERRGSGHYRVALFTSIAAVVPLFAFFHFTGSGAKTAAMAAAGLTVGGAFPMLASLARRSRGFTVGMRSALMLGGVWGVVTLVNMVLARLADRVELATGDPLAIEGIVGYIRFVPFVLAPMLWFAMKRYED